MISIVLKIIFNEQKLKRAAKKWHRLKPGPRTMEKTDPLKNWPVGKTGPQELNVLPFVSSYICLMSQDKVDDNVDIFI